MKYLFLITALIGGLVFSCKKKEVPKGIPYGGGGSSTGNSGIPSNSNVFQGVLYTGSSTYDSLDRTDFAFAYFTDLPLSFPSFNITGYLAVSKLLLNGDSLQPSGGTYASFNHSLQAIDNWTVLGEGPIPSFTVHNSITRPAFNQSVALPSSVDKSVGVTIQLPKMSNIRIGYCIISEGNNTSAQTMTFSPETQKLTLPPANWSGFQTNSHVVIEIAAENFQALEIGGKHFRFSKIIVQAKPITITQ